MVDCRTDQALSEFDATVGVLGKIAIRHGRYAKRCAQAVQHFQNSKHLPATVQLLDLRRPGVLQSTDGH